MMLFAIGLVVGATVVAIAGVAWFIHTFKDMWS